MSHKVVSILFYIVIIISSLFFFSELTLAVDETTVEHLISSDFQSTSGIATDTTGDDDYLTYTLPFPFTFYGNDYTTVYVSVNGYITFEESGAASCCGMRVFYADHPRIYAMGTDLATWSPGEDIFVTENSDSVRFRWKAETFTGGYPVNFEIVLYSNSNFELNYGENLHPINAYYTAVGISDGGSLYTASAYDGRTDFNFLQTAYWGDLPAEVVTLNSATFKKDTRCNWESPPQITFIKLKPQVKNGKLGMELNWTQYSANKVNIKIDDGTGEFPWTIEKTLNDGHEFLENVESWQQIKLMPINHCKRGSYSEAVSFSKYPLGWYNHFDN